MKPFIKFLFIGLIAGLSAQESDSTMSMSGGLGSITIDGKIYNQVSLRPEIPMGKLGIGLDIYLNIDSKGNIHTGDWQFKDFKSGARTIIDKIRYIRWGQPNDPLYARFGNLHDVQLGMGILVLGYTNALQYPSVRKLGLNFKGDFGTLGMEAIISDFKYRPGLTGARLSYKILPGLDLGLSFALDMDQYAGLPDRDGDKYPDVFDHFPDEIDKHDEAQEQMDEWKEFYYNSGTSSDDFNGFEEWFNNLPLNHNTYNPDSSKSNTVSAIAIDLSYRLQNGLLLYSQAAKLETQHSDSINFNGGIGFVPLGLKYTFGPATLQAEYRLNTEYFLFNYWDRSYEINRVTASNDSLVTKEDRLFNYGKMRGLFIQLQARFGNIVVLNSNYADMHGEVREDVDKAFETAKANKSFSSILSINTEYIPRLKKAELFYQQTNIPNPFAFDYTETTIYGYNLGIQISGDLILMYRSTTSFILEGSELEPINTIQLETQFTL